MQPNASTAPSPASASDERDRMRAELALGLASPQAMVAPKFLYDTLGSRLFEAICCLDEYYLTRCEAEIFERHAAAIGAAAGRGATLIDLGAGNCEKAMRLLDALAPRQYVPVDISADFLHAAVRALRLARPTLDILPVATDFSESLQLPPGVQQAQRLFFYPGSSLGNFTPLQALQFLNRLRQSCGPEGGLLIGIDLVKDTARMEAAYDDALGVTAAFNRNVLRNVNQILGADFRLPEWRHLARFNASQSRIEMHLEATAPTLVRWPGGERRFAAGATLHTENSYKYTKPGFLDLLAQAGFGNPSCWTDSTRSFLLCHAEAV